MRLQLRGRWFEGGGARCGEERLERVNEGLPRPWRDTTVCELVEAVGKDAPTLLDDQNRNKNPLQHYQHRGAHRWRIQLTAYRVEG